MVEALEVEKILCLVDYDDVVLPGDSERGAVGEDFDVFLPTQSLVEEGGEDPALAGEKNAPTVGRVAAGDLCGQERLSGARAAGANDAIGIFDEVELPVLLLGEPLHCCVDLIGAMT